MTLRATYVITRADDLGGAQIHVRDLATALCNQGVRVLVLGGGEGALAEELRDRDVPFESVPHLVRPVSPFEDIRALTFLRRRLDRFRPDLVSTHSSKAGVLGRLAAWSCGIPRLHTAHGWAFSEGCPKHRRLLGRTVERAVASITDRIITVSEADRELALTEGITHAGRIIAVHNSVVDAPGRARPARSPPRLIMVARMNPQKDHRTLFDALSGLLDHEWHLELIGDGPRMEATRREAAALGLADRISFLGMRRDVAERLAQAQCFTLISNWEGFPRSILEAMRAGLPVVASDVGGVRESVEDGVSGFVVPPNDPVTLRARLGELLAAPGLRERQGAAGRARFERLFSFDRFFRNTLEVYEGVVSDDAEDGLEELLDKLSETCDRS